MKQKYVISFSPDEDRISLREFAQVERDSYSLLCEEFFPGDAVRQAGQAGKEQLVDMLRTQNMYPPAAYAQAIAGAIMAMMDQPVSDSTELVFDDKDAMAENRQPEEIRDGAQAPVEKSPSPGRQDRFRSTT